MLLAGLSVFALLGPAVGLLGFLVLALLPGSGPLTVHLRDVVATFEMAIPVAYLTGVIPAAITGLIYIGVLLVAPLRFRAAIPCVVLGGAIGTLVTAVFGSGLPIALACGLPAGLVCACFVRSDPIVPGAARAHAQD